MYMHMQVLLQFLLGAIKMRTPPQPKVSSLVRSIMTYLAGSTGQLSRRES